MKAHKLQHFVASPQIPMCFLIETDCEAGNENPAYTDWEQQDQILFSWLQLTLSVSILSQIIECVHSYQLWEQIHEYFQKQTRAKARILRTNSELQCLSRKQCEFLLRTKCIVELGSCGDPILPHEHLDAILEGLPEEYSPVISVIESKYEPLLIGEVEALLLTHETRMIHLVDFRSHECLFLGYSTSHKGYKCLSPNGKLYVSKDVIFNELKYPYSDLFPPLSNSVTSSKSDKPIRPLHSHLFCDKIQALVHLILLDNWIVVICLFLVS